MAGVSGASAIIMAERIKDRATELKAKQAKIKPEDVYRIQLAVFD